MKMALFHKSRHFFEKIAYSWNEKADVIFMDQPVGTGFGSANLYLMTEELIARYMYNFLVKLIEKFPEYSGRDFYVSGESYAG